MHPHYKDRSKLISVARQGRQQLEEQMAQERALRTNNTPNPAPSQQVKPAVGDTPTVS